MDTKDKWDLLFLFGHTSSFSAFQTLPTFCASNIDCDFNEICASMYTRNFDRNSDNKRSAITLHQNDSHLYYLQLIPTEYHVLPRTGEVRRLLSGYRRFNTLYNELELDKHSAIDIVRLPHSAGNRFPSYLRQRYLYFDIIILIGSFLENKWIVAIQEFAFESYGVFDRHDNYNVVFNIY
ncbi:unnamed protein product [Absidia cylindrospora]